MKKNKYVFSNAKLDSEKYSIGSLMVCLIGHKLYVIGKDYVTNSFAWSMVDVFITNKKFPLLKKTLEKYLSMAVGKKKLIPIKKDVKNSDFPPWAKYTKDSLIFDKGAMTERDETMYDIVRVYYAFKEKEFNEFLDEAWGWFSMEKARDLFHEYSENLPVKYYFSLSEDESNMVLLSYYLWITKLLDGMWGPLIREDIPIFTNAILHFTCGIDFKKAISVSKELVKKRLFKKEHNFCLTDEVKNIMELNDLDDIIGQCFDKVLKKNTYKLDTFNVSKKNIELLRDILSADIPSCTLIYGSAGTGKTEFAKTLSLSIAKNVYIFNHSVFSEQQKRKDSEGDGRNLNYLEFLSLILSLGFKDKILIIDEADRVLSTAYHPINGESNLKSFVNQMLDNNRCKVIWITNDVKQIDTSTKRRFMYSILFNRLRDDVVRKSIYHEMKSLKLGGDLLEELTNVYLKYDTTMASLKYMKNIVTNIMATKKELPPQELIDMVKNVLSSNQRLLDRTNKRISKMDDPSYSLDVLNTDTNIPSLIEMTKISLSKRKQNPDGDNSVKILFYGVPGTGKSALATYIANALGKEILMMHASDILSMWVGESEQNIKRYFYSAEENDKVLIVDEADTFIYNREDASRSWERTQVNEFLTQMDEFRGILICTTNLMDILDPAIKRRFHMVVKFKAMNELGIRTLCKKYFNTFEFSEEMIGKLSHYDSVTPADFSTLSSRMRFISDDKLSPLYIIDELCKIQESKSPQSKIGF